LLPERLRTAFGRRATGIVFALRRRAAAAARAAVAEPVGRVAQGAQLVEVDLSARGLSEAARNSPSPTRASPPDRAAAPQPVETAAPSCRSHAAPGSRDPAADGPPAPPPAERARLRPPRSAARPMARPTPARRSDDSVRVGHGP
jgi:hypothetical protein